MAAGITHTITEDLITGVEIRDSSMCMEIPCARRIRLR